MLRAFEMPLVSTFLLHQVFQYGFLVYFAYVHRPSDRPSKSPLISIVELIGGELDFRPRCLSRGTVLCP